jgi:TolB-like protein/Tfp pilus assembly protein PilF
MPRRVTAILAIDVVGYSRLMGADDEGTLAQLKAHRRDLVDPKIREQQGRIVKTTGDGMLVEFASVVDALRCATEIQRDMRTRNAEVPQEKRIEFRAGLNVGDIIIDADDIYGDGVNVAARLESMADPGGICISGRVYEDTHGKLDIGFEDAGEQQLKNIAWPVRVYRVRLDGKTDQTRPALALPDKPSIAVLAFDNLSGDAEQEYFADGMVEEIIMALSRLRWLFVIARNSSFAYKGRAVDAKRIGQELGVRYLLEGSVRRAGNRVRIAGQLIDASTGAHLWADRYEGGIEDIFDLQDQVTASVVGAISPKLEQAEIERSLRKPTERRAAYDYYLRGLAGLHLWTREANKEATAQFYKAIELDPKFASAYGLAARCYSQRKASGWMEDRVHEIAETRRLSRRAAELGPDDALALCTAGFGLAYVAGELDDGIALIDRAIALNPNLAWAWYFSAWANVWLGQSGLAIERAERAMRLSPQDPHIFNMQSATAYGYFVDGRYAEALSWAQTAIRQRPDHTTSLRVLSASYAFLDRLEQAREAAARLAELDPALRISTLDQVIRFRRPDDLARLAEGLRRAGFPE